MEKTKTEDPLIEDRILETARELFFRNGIKSVTMDDIATYQGISKKTIYQYYKDKNALINSFTRNQTKCQHEDMCLIRKEADNAIQELLESMKYVGQFFSKINPGMFYDLRKYHPSAWNIFKKFKEDELIGFIEENMRKGVKQGLYRDKLNIKILSRLRLEQIELALDPKKFPPDQFSIVEVQLTMMEHFLQGVVTLKGHRLLNKYNNIIEEE
ncbi:MAG: TetR/AcrR family transcriptional regulator [Bacteroidetes bacterium]|nr:MAG: TetR/AcrR family transcriptional regulator [Bacteroidota bacterium]